MISEAVKTTQRYALFKDGKQIGKAHSTRLVVATEAFEQGAMVRGSRDFSSDPVSCESVTLADGYDIKELP